MPITLHILCSHLDFFQDNFEDFSKEHRKEFHQDIDLMERRYQGRWDGAIRF